MKKLKLVALVLSVTCLSSCSLEEVEPESNQVEYRLEIDKNSDGQVRYKG